MSSHPGIMTDAAGKSRENDATPAEGRRGVAGGSSSMGRAGPHIGGGTTARGGGRPRGSWGGSAGGTRRDGRAGRGAPGGAIGFGLGTAAGGLSGRRAGRGTARSGTRRDRRDRGAESVRAESAGTRADPDRGRRRDHPHGRHPRPLGRGLGVRPGEVGAGREVLDVVAHVFARRQRHARVFDLAARGRQQPEHGRARQEREAPAVRPHRRPRARGQHRFHPPWLSAAAGQIDHRRRIPSWIETPACARLARWSGIRHTDGIGTIGRSSPMIPAIRAERPDRRALLSTPDARGASRSAAPAAEWTTRRSAAIRAIGDGREAAQDAFRRRSGGTSVLASTWSRLILDSHPCP